MREERKKLVETTLADTERRPGRMALGEDGRTIEEFSDQLFANSELIPAVVQETGTGQVLMLAYMNRDSLKRTFETGYTWFWSRSRQELWNKGGQSGHLQRVTGISADCDWDALLVQVEQTGPACHTGHHSCFFHPLSNREENADEQENGFGLSMESAMETLYQTASERRRSPREDSYTCYLFDKGLDKILKKCGEECSEVIIAAKNGENGHTADEICDLLYHLTILMVEQHIPLNQITDILRKRALKIGNLKSFHPCDRQS